MPLSLKVSPCGLGDEAWLGEDEGLGEGEDTELASELPQAVLSAVAETAQSAIAAQAASRCLDVMPTPHRFRSLPVQVT